VAAALGSLHLLLILLTWNPAFDPGGDNAAYYGLARSLLERGDYVELWDPQLVPHTLYPPGFPLILAAAMRLGVQPWAGFKLLVAGFGVLAVAVSYLWARKAGSPRTGFFVGLLLAISPGVVAQSQRELSDVPFLLFTFAALFSFAQCERSDQRIPPASCVGWVAAGSAATMLACLTRAAGLPLALAAGGWLALRGRRRALVLFLAIVGPPVAAWLVWQATARGGATYTSYLWVVDPYRPELGAAGARDLLARVLKNALAYPLTHLSTLLTGLARWPLAAVFGAVVTVTSLVVWTRRLRRPGVAELFLPLYLALIFAWPAQWATDRLLLPVLPLLLLYSAEALRDVGARVNHPCLLLASALTVVVATDAAKTVKQTLRAGECRAAYASGDRYACYPAEWGDFGRLAEQVRGTLPQGAVVLSRKPRLFWVISGYRSRKYPLTTDPDLFFREAREVGADYVVLDPSQESARYLQKLLGSRPDDFCTVPGVGGRQAALVRVGTTGQSVPQDAPSGVLPFCPPPPK
jgi:4-amino-4-deoxy-L-arabinose transferase-like glycosyltransferase